MRAVYLRALAVVYIVALVSLWVQIEGLVGNDGILPFVEHLSGTSGRLAGSRFWKAPTLLWLWPTMAGMHAIFAIGLGLAAAVVVGTWADGWMLFGMWAIYLSMCTAGQEFLAFQWDSLLVEACFAGALLASWLPGSRSPPRWAVWLHHWVVFKLFFFGGLVKLTSGDDTWRDGTALTYHYWTQPLPNPLSWPVDALPGWMHAGSMWLMFGLELVVPFWLVLGSRWRRAAAPCLMSLLVLLALTGNYGWFQLLGLVLCLTLLDDGVWHRILPVGWHVRPTLQARHVGLPVAVLLVAISLLFARGYREVPTWTQPILQLAWPFRTANTYGLFARMTTDRPVVQFERSSDGGHSWQALVLPWSSGPVNRRPGQVAPHMPRLDWQLWFAALGECRRNPWVMRTQQRLADGSPAVWALLASGRPDETENVMVRTTRWSYRFAGPGSADWYERTLVGPYCPAVRSTPDL
jgi:hypothetical protein